MISTACYAFSNAGMVVYDEFGADVIGNCRVLFKMLPGDFRRGSE